MQFVPRRIETSLSRALNRGRSVLLLGPRQTGKTTLVERLGADLTISLVDPEARRRYEAEPGLLAGEIEALGPGAAGDWDSPLVVLDEIQRVPLLLDSVQHLIDSGRARFVLTGSSARKLRRGAHVNLLPGRVVALRLDPFILDEMRGRPRALDSHLLEGDLPPIVAVAEAADREVDLESYVNAYLEEEVRAEALVRDLGPFSRFLELAAMESGRRINVRKLSQQIGVAQSTIAAYYQILEDCLIIERIPPLTSGYGRKRLAKTDSFLFFDLGVRRLAAGEGRRQSPERLGALFEQFVGLELLRCARLLPGASRLRCWRDLNGPEVDWVLEREGRYLPVEAKWTDTPRQRDIRHLKLFVNEYPQADQGTLVCRVPRPIQLDHHIQAIPWQAIDQLVLPLRTATPS
jgi:predicted AAA+ superfamily ATPase